jgi:outer membrane protein assembly factor BamE
MEVGLKIGPIGVDGRMITALPSSTPITQRSCMSVRYVHSMFSQSPALLCGLKLRLHRSSQLACLSVLGLLTGCSSTTNFDNYLPGFLKTYRIDIQQGNVVTQEMVDQLKVGMTREQVRFVLGTPLLVDPFKANRWEYVYRFQRGTGQVDLRKYVVTFVDDRLATFSGEVSPTENRGQATIVTLGKKPGEIAIEKLQAPANPDALEAPTASPAVPEAAPATPPTTPPTTAPQPVTDAVAPGTPVVAAVVAPVTTAIALTPEIEASLKATIAAWRQAWAARTPKVYFGFYSPQFDTGKLTRAEWEQLRKTRLLQSKVQTKTIRLELGELRSELLAADQAKVVFKQTYQAGKTTEVGVKTLILRLQDGRWLIESEQFLPE